jgi:DNA-directed RNA polymerase II subunit RPB1
MNLFLPQNIQTQMELSYIADVKKQIISPTSSNPIIKFKQDTPAGVYLLTEKKVDIDWHEAMNMSMYLNDFDPTKIQKKDVNTHQLFSFIIPEMINYAEYGSDGKKTLDINNGELLQGTVNGSVLTSKLITFIWDRYGPKKTKVFIDNAQRLSEAFLLHKGFTVGYKDSIPSKEFKQEIIDLMYKKELESAHLLTEFENNPDLLDPETFEKSLFSNLQTVQPNVGKLALKNINSSNNFFVMVDSGAKGSFDNIGAILAGKGQNILKFKRIEKTVNGRTLPHFCYNDDSAVARGFISNSYNDGMEPYEFWYYHQSGREGIINTAVKTAETGYQQRKMIKAMEDIMVTYDGTVRTSNNIILQMIYGDNQLDQTMQKRVPLHSLSMGITKLKDKYLFEPNQINELVKLKHIEAKEKAEFEKANVEFYSKLKESRDLMRHYQLKARVNYSNLQEFYFQPVNYSRIINDIKNFYNADETVLSPFYVLEQIEHILSHQSTPLLYYRSKDKNPVKAEIESKYKFLFRLALMEYLGPKRCILEYKFNKSKFDMVVSEIIQSFNKTLIQPGEMVGIVAAQSMGEPLTQMTLSSFHKSGSGVAGLQGTPRIRELLSYTKDIQQPYMFVYMKPEYSNDKIIVNKIAASLRYTVMKDLVKKLDIIYDPSNTYSEQDSIDTKSIFYINGQKTSGDLGSMPWLFRIHLSREALLDYDINMIDIKSRFVQFWENKFFDLTNVKKNVKDFIGKIIHGCILTNYSNSSSPIAHVRFELNNIDNKTLADIQDIIINKFNLKGDELITKIDSIQHDSNLSFDNVEEEPSSTKEYVIYTEGINLQKLRQIPYIDQNRTVCNSIDIIYRLYGIEAARSGLVKEVDGTFTNGGSTINFHHVSIVCDLMTHSGSITSIDRFGLNRLDTDPLARASFEKTIEVLINAAVFNETDFMRSVSSRIMAGKIFRGGTGLCDVMLDNEILENSEFDEYKGAKNISEKDFVELSRFNLIDDILGKEEINDIYIPV